ncbi:MAG: cell wall hydrolase [Gammaproteobacteria bacterium]|nr:cell wall hydrolase [Gammaproteobacteria bacterium]
MKLHLEKQLKMLLRGFVLLMIMGVVTGSSHYLGTTNQFNLVESSLSDQDGHSLFEEEIAFLNSLPEHRSILFEIKKADLEQQTLKARQQQRELEKQKRKAAQQRRLRENFKAYVRQLSRRYQVLAQFAKARPGSGKDLDMLSELQCMALNLYFEARSESKDGQKAVAHVVMNRVRHSGFPRSICDVVKQGGEDKRYHCQFTWWCDGHSDRPRNKRSWRQSVVLAAQVLSNQTSDPTNGALWYHAEYVNPYWRSSMQKGPKIGKHIFYLSRKSDSQPTNS